LTDFYNRVGTRIVLLSSSVTGKVAASSILKAAVTLENDGFGRVVREPPVSYVLLSNGIAFAQAAITTIDPRTLASSSPPKPATFSFDISLPASLPKGSIDVALFIADPATPTDPTYALPLNSNDSNGLPVFDAATGNNSIATLQQ
jgi:hypothetical protein